MTIVEAFRSGISSIFDGYVTFDKAQDIWDKAKKKKPNRYDLLIGNNTWLREVDTGFKIKLHGTDIIELLPTGEYIIDTKGWHTQLAFTFSCMRNICQNMMMNFIILV